MTTLPITLTIAGAAALVNLWLAFRVVGLRVKHKMPLGDGGNAVMLGRMRAQSNFTEYAPFVLILLGLVELSIGSVTWLWFVGIAFILARLAHGFGMDRPAPNALRAGGAVTTWIILLGLAGLAIAIPYLELMPPKPTML